MVGPDGPGFDVGGGLKGGLLDLTERTSCGAYIVSICGGMNWVVYESTAPSPKACYIEKARLGLRRWEGLFVGSRPRKHRRAI